MAVDLALAQLGDVREPAGGSTLGIVYVTAVFDDRLGEIARLLAQRTGVSDWVGAAGLAICATGVEYDDDEPAVAILLACLPANGFTLFSGRHRAPSLADRDAAGLHRAGSALVHGDPSAPDVAGLVADMAQRTSSGLLFGGLVSVEADRPSQLAGDVVSGGLSGAVFSESVRLLSRVTQGCTPLAGEHVVSECTSNYIKSLDGRPALDVMLSDLGVTDAVRNSSDGDEILRALPADRLRRGLFVGLAPSGAGRGFGFGEYTVRNVIGIDPHSRVLAVGAQPHAGDRAVFCTRDQQAARSDLIRICTELREEIEAEALQVRGAVYISCVARGRHLFGTASAEQEIIRHNLGDIPMIGFYANGEIAGDKLYGYTGVLTLFV